MKVYSIPIHWDKTQILKKFSSDETNGTKDVLFFCELQFVKVLVLICDSYTSWSTSFVSQNLCVKFSIFDSVSFLLKFIFLFNKIHGLFDFKTSSFFSKLNNRKATHSFASSALTFLLQQEVLKLNDICLSWSSPKTNLVKKFLKPENQSCETVSVETFKLLFDIPLLNSLFISFLNLFISLTELKTLLNNLFIYFLTYLFF